MIKTNLYLIQIRTLYLYFIRDCGDRDPRGKKASNINFEKELNDFL